MIFNLVQKRKVKIFVVSSLFLFSIVGSVLPFKIRGFGKEIDSVQLADLGRRVFTRQNLDKVKWPVITAVGLVGVLTGNRKILGGAAVLGTAVLACDLSSLIRSHADLAESMKREIPLARQDVIAQFAQVRQDLTGQVVQIREDLMQQVDRGLGIVDQNCQNLIGQVDQTRQDVMQRVDTLIPTQETIEIIAHRAELKVKIQKIKSQIKKIDAVIRIYTQQRSKIDPNLVEILFGSSIKQKEDKISELNRMIENLHQRKISLERKINEIEVRIQGLRGGEGSICELIANLNADLNLMSSEVASTLEAAKPIIRTWKSIIPSKTEDLLSDLDVASLEREAVASIDDSSSSQQEQQEIGLNASSDLLSDEEY